MPGPSLGLNLGEVVDWTTAFPFVDLFKTSRPWFTQSATEWDTGEADLLDLDAQGWVRGFTRDGSPAPFEAVSTVWNTFGDYQRDGLFVIDWAGAGDLQVHGARVVSRSDHRIVIDPGTEAVTLSITATDPAGTGDYIRDIRIYHRDDRALLDVGVVFNPAFVEKIGDFRVLRFMEWMNTNGTDVRDWDDATPLEAAHQTSFGDQKSGVSIDMMVALANEVRADPWFNIPHLASADYIRRFATYVRDNLDPGLVARFEYSNEVWNDRFEQGKWALRQAAKAWGDVEDGGVQWYGMKAAKMARIVEQVFGEETGTRALNVFATQAGWLGRETLALEAPAHVAQGGQPPHTAPFHVYAIQPYFGFAISGNDMADTVEAWISRGEEGVLDAIEWLANDPSHGTLANIGEIMGYHARRAEGLQWQLEGYEGGQHVVDRPGLFGGTNDPERAAFFNAVVARPEMAELYERYFDIWRAEGGGVMLHYTDFAPVSDYGSFGLWESAYAADTSRAAAVEAFRDGQPAWWNDHRPASAFVGIRTVVDYDRMDSLVGSAGSDRLFGLGGADRLDGRAGSDSLYGSDGNDTLHGGGGADRLEGGAGQDRLVGGRGSDGYLVDAGDVVVEQSGQGAADRVASVVDWTLGAWLENLDLVGPGDLAGTGNWLANRITALSGDNRLSGRGGDDVLLGRGGDDKLWGGAGVDQLHGAGGRDRLDGGAGLDRLTGGPGDDAFVFGSPEGAGDRIADFSRESGNRDRLLIDASSFGGGLIAGSALPGTLFQVDDDAVLSGTAERPIRFVFESDTARLWFDENGSLAGGLHLVAKLQPGAMLAAQDIWLF